MNACWINIGYVHKDVSRTRVSNFKMKSNSMEQSFPNGKKFSLISMETFYFQLLNNNHISEIIENFAVFTHTHTKFVFCIHYILWRRKFYANTKINSSFVRCGNTASFQIQKYTVTNENRIDLSSFKWKRCRFIPIKYMCFVLCINKCSNFFMHIETIKHTFNNRGKKTQTWTSKCKIHRKNSTWSNHNNSSNEISMMLHIETATVQLTFNQMKRDLNANHIDDVYDFCVICRTFSTWLNHTTFPFAPIYS